MNLSNGVTAELRLRSIIVAHSLLEVERQGLIFATRIEECRLMRQLLAGRDTRHTRSGTRGRARQGHAFRRSGVLGWRS